MSDTPTPKTIRVSRALSERPIEAEILRDHIGTQLYLAIGSTHIRSQHFGAALLKVVRCLRKAKALPKTPEQLAAILEAHGRQDFAVEQPWSVRARLNYIRPPVEGETDWYKAERGRLQKANNALLAERNTKLQAVLDAWNGKDPWQVEWIEPADKAKVKP